MFDIIILHNIYNTEVGLGKANCGAKKLTTLELAYLYELA